MTESVDPDLGQVAKSYFQLIDKILQHFAGDLFREEIAVAKSQFFDNAGILDESSPQYELRMNQFFDWYFFTRDLRGFGQTPLESFQTARELRLVLEEVRLVEKLKNHRHSLFEFLKVKGTDIYLRDLLHGDKLMVRLSPWNYGFESDEIFEVRLIPHEDTWIFTKGFCFHPAEARKFIMGEVKRHKKDPDLNVDAMMLRLLRMRYKFERYRHVNPTLIYSADSKLGV